MHGVPAELPLAPFINCEVVWVDLGLFSLHFHFASPNQSPLVGPVPVISVEGKWELANESGEIVDGDQEGVDSWRHEAYRIHRILGQIVSRYEINPPISFTLWFQNGYSLTIYDNSTEYESFSVGTFYV